jgi:integrase
VKRHLGALSQFFQFAVDQGHITVAARAELTANHRFREDAGAREQRDAWSPEELKALFSSPIWTGSHPTVRTRPGPEIIRDAKFWLPLLALFHGGRLEEFADLYRRDVGCENGIWFLRITEDGGRRLKTDNAERVIPLHPEVLRCCFLDYVRRIAPNVDDPLFPDLERQGKDGKRGARFTRFFVNYRKTLRLYREGVGMHAFRHLANTRLRDKAEGYQHDRRISYLLGHSQGGGEGRERYDKGPGLKALAETLALLEYPELDLSHLHISQPAAGPVQAA